MPKNKHADREAANQLINHIDAAERKLRMMKQYINPDAGIIHNPEIINGLFAGAAEEMKIIEPALRKFY